MRTAYAHEAVLDMPADHDARAVGAAVTQLLCGHWDHDGPCPVAAHHTSWSRDGETMRVRVLFAAEPAAEAGVRAMVEAALSNGTLVVPGEGSARWRVCSSGPSAVLPAESDHAERLVEA